jgi:hypothetical protein
MYETKEKHYRQLGEVARLESVDLR